MAQLPTADEVRSVLDYDPKTGWLTWKRRRDVPQPWNTRFAGHRAGGVSNVTGYRLISINWRQYYAHRIAWLIHYGEWPSGEVDHKNGDQDDNSLSNLRECSRGENAQNLPARPGASRYHGVGWDKRRRKWYARIKVVGRPKFLGYFICELAARDAYLAAKAEHHVFQRVPREAAE
jgi:hypothetical protein